MLDIVVIDIYVWKVVFDVTALGVWAKYKLEKESDIDFSKQKSGLHLASA